MTVSAITLFSLLVIGFSVFSAVLLAVAYLFFLKTLQKTASGMLACSLLLAALVGLQLFHLGYLVSETQNLFDLRLYVLLLLVAPPTFYFFSRELLLSEQGANVWQLVHLLPLVLGLFLPVTVLAPAAFIIGAGYTVWFARVVYGLRRHVGRFRFEMFFFSLFAALAILVLVLFSMVPYMEAGVFFVAYANFIGFSLFLIVSALLVFPEMLQDISDVAQMAYARSTLKGVDIDAKVGAIDQAMTADKIYQNENLNLKMLADIVVLSPHQLSELINSRFGTSFSRFVREQRIREAKRLLVEDPQASVLSISLATGFRSQSNFYAAFQEIAGVSPGQYRKSPD